MVTERRQVPKLEFRKKKITFSVCGEPAEGIEKPVKTKQKLNEDKERKTQDLLCNRSK